MKSTYQLLSALLTICIICNLLSINAFAQDNVTSAEASYVEFENGATWGTIKDETVYFVTVYNSGCVYISKTDLNDENNIVYETEFYYNSNSNFSQYSDEYWEEIIDFSTKSRALWNSSNGIEVTAVVVPETTLGAIRTKIKNKYGNTYTQKHLLTDSTSYPGYSFTVRENHTIGVVQCNSLEYTQKTTLGAMATTLCTLIPGMQSFTAIQVLAVLADFYGMAANASLLMTTNGNLITYYCTSVLSRYTTVNGGTVNYSEATEKRTNYIHYDTSVIQKPLGELKHEVITHTPSDYAFTSTGYRWLINTAYNNYT